MTEGVFKNEKTGSKDSDKKNGSVFGEMCSECKKSINSEYRIINWSSGLREYFHKKCFDIVKRRDYGIE